MIARLLKLIRFSHTIFALPFALGAMVVAAGGWPGWWLFGWILAAMVCARTAAMLFNRLADWDFDKRNPRTAQRHQLVSRPAIAVALVASSGAFIGASAALNRLCFLLSVPALAIVFFYSLTKRFTDYSHFFLGLALAVAPVGAWIAVRGSLDWPVLALAGSVLLWVAGFDLIYATQDVDFDVKEGLHSMVVRLGIPGSLRLAQGLHALMFCGLAAFGWAADLGIAYFGGLPIVLGALMYEHAFAKKRDVHAINRAFFHSNAVVGVVFVLATTIDRWIESGG